MEQVSGSVIGPGGGFVELAGCRLTFPPGAFESETSVHVEVSQPGPATPPGYLSLTPIVNVDHEKPLLKPVMVQLPTLDWFFMENVLPDAIVNVFHQQDGSNEPRAIATEISSNENGISFECSSFSRVWVAIWRALFGPITYSLTMSLYKLNPDEFVQVFYRNEKSLKENLRMHFKEQIHIPVTISAKLNDVISSQRKTVEDSEEFYPAECSWEFDESFLEQNFCIFSFVLKRSRTDSRRILAEIDLRVNGESRQEQHFYLQTQAFVLPTSTIPIDQRAHPSKERTDRGKLSKLADDLRFYEKRKLGERVFEGIWGMHGVETKVAVKILPASEIRSKREVQAMLKLGHHPNVVSYIAAGEFRYRGFPSIYLAMELCRSEHLYQVVISRSLPPGHRKIVLLQISHGLEYIHENKIKHRDIKPTNILWSSDGKNVKIADLSKQESEDMQNKSTTYMGSYGWGAPETYNSQRTTQASDVFSTGLVLYFVLSGGKHAFGNEPILWQNNIEKMEGLDLSSLSGAEAEIGRDVVRKMLQQRKEDRPKMARVLSHPLFWNTSKRVRFLCDANVERLQAPHKYQCRFQSEDTDQFEVMKQKFMEIGGDGCKTLQGVVVAVRGLNDQYPSNEVWKFLCCFTFKSKDDDYTFPDIFLLIYNALADIQDSLDEDMKRYFEERAGNVPLPELQETNESGHGQPTDSDSDYEDARCDLEPREVVLLKQKFERSDPSSSFMDSVVESQRSMKISRSAVETIGPGGGIVFLGNVNVTYEEDSFPLDTRVVVSMQPLEFAPENHFPVSKVLKIEHSARLQKPATVQMKASCRSGSTEARLFQLKNDKWEELNKIPLQEYDDLLEFEYEEAGSVLVAIHEDSLDNVQFLVTGTVYAIDEQLQVCFSVLEEAPQRSASQKELIVTNEIEMKLDEKLLLSVESSEARENEKEKIQFEYKLMRRGLELGMLETSYTGKKKKCFQAHGIHKLEVTKGGRKVEGQMFRF